MISQERHLTHLGKKTLKASKKTILGETQFLSKRLSTAKATRLHLELWARTAAVYYLKNKSYYFQKV